MFFLIKFLCENKCSPLMTNAFFIAAARMGILTNKSLPFTMNERDDFYLGIVGRKIALHVNTEVPICLCKKSLENYGAYVLLYAWALLELIKNVINAVFGACINKEKNGNLYFVIRVFSPVYYVA